MTSVHAPPPSSGSSAVEQLQEVMGGQLDRLVLPLRGAVVTGDEPRAMDSAEVSVDEGVSGLRLVGGALGEPEVPLRVVLPGVLLEERVLGVGPRLHFTPLAADDVLAGLDQLACARNAAIVHRVGGHASVYPIRT